MLKQNKLKNRWTALYCLVIIHLSYSPNILAQSNSYINYQIKDGLPSNNVYDIIQDKDDFIWLATESGLSRYDGQYFRNYTTKDSTSDIEILDLYIDSKDRMWCNSYNGKIFYIKNGVIYTSNNSSLLKSIPKLFWKDIIENKKGELVIIQQDNITRLKGNEVDTKTEFKRYEGSYILETPDNEEVEFCYNKVYDQFITNLNLDTYSIDTLRLKNSQIIEGVFSDGKGIYIWDKSWIYYYDGIEISPQIPLTGLDSKSEILKIYKIKSTYWITTTNNGVYNLSETAGQWKVNHLLENQSIPSLTIDSDDNIWLASLGKGIFKVDASQETVYNKLNGLDHDEVETFFIDKDHLIIGDTYANLFLKKNDASPIKRISKKTKDKYDKIRCIEKTGPNNFLIGSDNFFVSTDLKTGDKLELEIFGSKDLISVGKDSALIATATSLHLLSRNNKSEKITDSLIRRPLSLSKDNKDRVWIGTLTGLSYVDGFDFNQVQEFNLGLDDRINDLHSKDAMTCACCANQGLIIITEDSTLRLDINNGLVSNNCNSVFIDEQGFIWYATNEGLNKIERDKKGVISIDLFGANSGLISNQIKKAEVFEKRIYLATNKGLQVIDAGELSNSLGSIPYLDHIKVNDQKIPIGKDKFYSFSHTDNNLEFGFSSVNFSTIPTYKYRLKNHDPEWRFTKLRQLNYYNLDPGKYTFQLIDPNSKDNKNDVLDVKFSIEPRFLQTKLFKTLVSVLGIMLLLAFYRWRKKTRDRKIELTKLKTQAELKALRAQINPHFLFNALNSIQDVILEQDVDKANDYLSEFSKLMRITLEQSKSPLISISKEIDSLKLYLKLESLRFDSKFIWKISVDENLDKTSTLIPSFILQPLVENAIWHGLLKKKGDAHLNVEFKQKGDYILCIVDDDGLGMQATKNLNALHESTALKNLKERIFLLNEDLTKNISFEIKESIIGSEKYPGTRIEILIPNEL